MESEYEVKVGSTLPLHADGSAIPGPSQTLSVVLLLYLSIYPIGSASSFHSSVSSAPCNVDNSSGRGSLASDTIAVPTYGQALITSTAEQNSASKAGRAGLPLVVAALAQGSGFNIVLWPGEG